MSIVIRKEGVLTTVQDFGRNGFRRFGINPNGVSDRTAFQLINILLGNRENEPVLETHFPAAEIIFQENAVFAVAGADFAPRLNEKLLENWKTYFANKGDVLNFSAKKFGRTAYVAIRGGFKTDFWLGSASTNLTAKAGGFGGGKLKKNDCLRFNLKSSEREILPRQKISASLIPAYEKNPVLRVLSGAEYDSLTGLSENQFLRSEFTVSKDSNRMGFRLRGEPLHLLNHKELVSSAVDFGTIQLLPDGQLIILMADHPTSGGYPRIAHIVAKDLPVAAQLEAGNKIRFELISIEEAEKISLDAAKDLNLFRVGCKFSRLYR